MSLSIANAIWRARQNALSRAGERAPRSAVAQHGYDPNQPRAPAGHPDGGQWTRDAHGPSNPEEVVLNEDGSTVRSEVNTSNLSIPWEERHTVRMPDGEEFTFENFGFTQTIYDADGRPISQTVLTSDGPEPQAVVESVRGRPAPGGPKGGELVSVFLTLFAALSGRNQTNRTAALAFRASEFETQGHETPEWVGQLTEREVRATCDRYDQTQGLLEGAVKKVTKENDYANEADFGNKVHKEVELAIKAKGNPDWLAEESMQKLAEEDPRIAEETRLRGTDPGRRPPERPNPGAKGSIRIDVLDRQANGSTVCVYDIKTGAQHRLSWPRMAEIARGVYFHFPQTQSIIVVEMRPKQR